MKMQSTQQRGSDDFDSTDKFKSPELWSFEQVFTATSITQTFQYSMINVARQNQSISCVYSGPNKEIAFTFNASRVGGPAIGVSSVLSSVQFGGVGVTVTANANGNSVEIEITSGAVGATLTARGIRSV